MSEDNIVLNKLQLAVSIHSCEMLQVAIDEALDAGTPVLDMHRALVLGLEEVRHKLMSNNTSIPDFLLCIDTVTEGFNRLSSVHETHRNIEDSSSLVIGVVQGDPHDLGKNIIAAVYGAYGYRVFDLGREVTNEKFVKSVEDNRAEILALSAMMSTTAIAMRDIIRDVKARSPDMVVMAGGASLDRILATRYGADGYAESAATVIEETEAAIKRVRKANHALP